MHEQTKTVIVMEEDPHLLPVIAALIKADDLRVVGLGDPVEAVAHCGAAGPDALVLLSAALAASSPDLIENLMSSKRPPTILLTCCRPPTCPLDPSVECLGIGCLEKPLDFTKDRLRHRVKQAFGIGASSPPARQE